MTVQPYQFMPPREVMLFVCDDENGPSKWYYDGTTKRYVRFDLAGGLMAHIRGESLPDPMALWERRIKIYGTQSREATRPQPATLALWDDWQERTNA